MSPNKFCNNNKYNDLNNLKLSSPNHNNNNNKFKDNKSNKQSQHRPFLNPLHQSQDNPLHLAKTIMKNSNTGIYLNQNDTPSTESNNNSE